MNIKQRLRESRPVYDVRRRLIMAYKRRRYRLSHVHKTFFMSGASKVSRDLVAGAFSYMGPGCDIGPQVSIGRYTMLGPRVVITGGDHVIDRAGVPAIFSGRPKLEPTVLDDDCWVGYGAIVIAGCTIGRGAVVAAGAVVTHDVPPYEIHGGVPARKIGDRFPSAEDVEVHEAMLRSDTVQGEFAPPKESLR